MEKLKEMKKEFCKRFETDRLHERLIDTDAKAKAINQWFDEQEWSAGSEGDWERFLLFRSFSDKPADPLLILQMMPLSGMDPEPIPDQSWPFSIQHSLETILHAEGRPQPQSYITLFEAMIHLHFVVLASQFYWAMEKKSREGVMVDAPEIRCAYHAIFQAMTDHGCMGGNVWADRAGLITLGSHLTRERLPFQEMVDVLEPKTLTCNTVKTGDDEPCYVLAKSGRARDIIKFASEIRNKMFHADQILSTGMDYYQDGLDLLVDLFGMLFAPYHGKGLAVVDERTGADGQRNQAIFCYWEGLASILSTNSARRIRQKMLSLWNGQRPDGLDIIPAPAPPSEDLSWDESLLFFDPAAPYERYVYLMPFGFRYAHRRLRDEESGRQYIPGLVDSVRWAHDRVQVIIQRTYAGLGPDVRTFSDKIPDDEGIDHRQNHFKSLEHIAASIMSRYGLKIPKTSRTFASFRHHFDLGHSAEALKLATQTVPRQSALDAVEQTLLSHPDRRLILIGSSGRGKTHVAAQFYKRHEHRSVYLSFDCGIPPMTENVKEQEGEEGGGSLSAPIRMHLLAGVCRALNVVELPTVILGKGEVENRILDMMRDPQVSDPIYIVVDGLNQCADPEQAFLALHEPLPPNLYLLATTQPIDIVLKQITHHGRRTWGRLELEPLTETETQQMVNFYWNPPNEKKLPPLPEAVTTKLWSTCQGQPIFVMAWTEELKKLYKMDSILFEDRAIRLLDSSKGLGLPDSLRDRFEAVLNDFNPKAVGDSICLVLSMIQRALTPDEIYRGLKELQTANLPESLRPPSCSRMHVEDFLGRMGGFFHRDDTNSGYRFIHETFSRWYQRSIPEELIPDIRLALAPLGCMQLTPESTPEAIALWVQRVDDLDPVYEDLPPTVRVGLLVFLREHFAKIIDKERYYSLLFDLVYTFDNILGEATRAFPLEQEAEEGLKQAFLDATKTFLLLTLAEIHKIKKHFDTALNYYQKAKDILERESTYAGIAKGEWCLTFIYSKIGQIYAGKGEYPTAKHFHQKCLEIRESMARSIPSHKNRLIVSMGLVKMGEIQFYMGDLVTALCHYHRALEIRQALVAERPTYTNRLYLAWIYTSLGIAYRGLGQIEKSLEVGNKALEIRQELYDELPTIKHTMFLTYSLDGLSLRLKDLGRLSESATYRKRTIELGEKIVNQVPTIGNRGDLSGYYNQMGLTEKAQGNFNTATDKIFRAVEMRETLLSEANTYMRRRMLCISYRELAGVHLAMGNADEALGYLRKAIAIAEPLVEEAPIILNRRVLAKTYEVMSDAVLAKTDSEDAFSFQQKAFEIAKRLKDDSSFMEDQRLYPTICRKLAHIHHAMGNVQEALSLAAEAVQILDGLTEKAPVLDNRKELAQALSVASAVYASSGKHDEAVAAIHRAISMMEKMIEDAPEMVEYPRLLGRYRESLDGLEELPPSLED